MLKNVGEKGAMSAPKIITLEALFILIFGIFHFAVPFILPPNYANTGFIAGLQVADFVIPGCFTLAIISIIVFITKNRYAAVALSFLYGGGVVFHSLYLSGAFPRVIIAPSKLLLVAGMILDALAIVAIYQYCFRFPLTGH
jgi:hypothetical protein